jgi:molybdopterin-guanine dinucleotide biosynthesis protein A/molybdopterin converting factor small subunit
MSGALHGLLLAGGKSSRMGRDKASIVLGGDGLTQAGRALGLLRQFCGPVCLSLREGQSVPSGGEGVPVLRDAPGAQGPLAGILAAFHQAPGAAWLVMACDLPLVRPGVLARLAARYAGDPSRPFVAYASASDGLPEPLCAIYGPSARPVLERHAARGHFCPRHILREENALLLPLPEAEARVLTNVNTPEDLAGAVRAVRNVRVVWFGHLAGRRGVREESVVTAAETAGAFRREMGDLHGLNLDPSVVRVAVNDEFAPEELGLHTGDKVVFLPPFAGG